MASNIDIGNQKITFDFKQPAKGSEFSKLLFSVVKPGVYKGLNISLINENKINISAGHAFLNCSYQGTLIRTATVEFQTDFILDISPTIIGQNEIVYIYYEYAQVTENYVEVKHINSGSINDLPSTAVILCELQYNSSNYISDILYDKRTFGLFDYESNYSLPDINLKFSSFSDKSKKFRFNISNVSQNQTRVIGLPDYDYNIGTIDDWFPNRKYNIKEPVIYNGIIYRCNATHTSSSSFFSDVSKWDNLTKIEDEKGVRVYAASGVNQSRVVTLVGDYSSELIPSVGHLTSYSQEPFGIVPDTILAGQTGDVIQRGRISVAFNSSSGQAGQKVYSDSSGNLTLNITPLIVGQLLTPSSTSSIIYVGILPSEEGLNPINFSGQLSSEENSIQKAFDRIDDYGYIPFWTQNQNYRIANSVIYNSVIYECIEAHTSTSVFDNAKWFQVNEPPIIPQDQNTYYAGDKVFRIVQKEQIEGLRINQEPQFSTVKVNELEFTSISNISSSGVITSLDVSNRSFVRLTGQSVQLSGIQSPSGTIAQYLAISNVTGSNILITNENSSSVPKDRIITGVESSITVSNSSTVTFMYDFLSQRWRIVGSPVSNHNLLFNLQGGDGTNYFHSNQPINTTDDVSFRSVTVNTTLSSSGVTITSGDNAPNRFPYVNGNIGTIYLQSNGTKWSKVGFEDYEWRADWIGDLTDEPTGFPIDKNTGEVDRTSSILSMTGRVFTISPAASGSSYSIIIKGREVVVPSSISITIPNTSGLYFIYFNDSGALTWTSTFNLNIIYKFVYVAVIYWSAEENRAIYIGDERHGSSMDAHTHARIHQVDGAVFISGSALSDFQVDGNGTNNNQVQFSIGSGFIRDEDILHTLGSKLSTDAIPVFYRQGLNWRRADNPGHKFHYNTRAYFNSNISGNYSLSEVSNNNFCLYHIIATNDKDNPYISLMGLNEYTTKNSAREGALTEISQYIGLPFLEFVFIGTVIFECKDSYSTVGKSRIVTTDTGANYVDWRFAKTLNPSTAGVNNHNNLGSIQGGLGGNFYHSDQPINTSDKVSFRGITSDELTFSNIVVDNSSNSISNLSISGTSFVKLVGTGLILNGIEAPVGDLSKYVIITNASSTTMQVGNEDLSTPSNNRIITGAGKPVSISVNSTIVFVYDFYSLRWRMVGGSGSGGGASLIPTAIKTSNYTCIPSELVICDTTTIGWQLLLYNNPNDGDVVGVLDIAGKFSEHPLQIKSPNMIQNDYETWLMDINFTYMELIYSSIADSWFFKEVPAGLNAAVEGNKKLSHDQNITQANLVNGKVQITHNMNVEYPVVQVYDNNRFQIIPSEVRSISASIVEVDLTGYIPINGTWRVRIV